ncbi:hypothetical protein PR048_031776 [Dryococelus australis]|uniref:Uncharacterized protein n=1 Tax=Dryococelus australis TaxID=614101 RepID=A0ABQ9G685_9NEOP|nr:hypothetical protein PR048_031776 [Dryococelus australis]
MHGWGKREISEKTCRPAASSGTIPICENPGVTRSRIEPGSPRSRAGSLTTQPSWIVAPFQLETVPLTSSGRGATVAERLYCSPPTNANRVQSAVGSLHIFAIGNHAVRVLTGICRFPRPCIPVLLHSHLISPSSALKTSMLKGAQISQHHRLADVCWRWRYFDAFAWTRRTQGEETPDVIILPAGSPSPGPRPPLTLRSSHSLPCIHREGRRDRDRKRGGWRPSQREMGGNYREGQAGMVCNTPRRGNEKLEIRGRLRRRRS